ncbi:DEAD/DEAH box helicase family protein [Phascolarctobacterium sp.]|uniref:DEAD/DEAH box helicase family protein n=1 Tax=Phascolarctobacterium sp. TaxID=2049039 RepID=UPI00304F4C83
MSNEVYFCEPEFIDDVLYFSEISSVVDTIKDSYKEWIPATPVIISAQTGSGKNYLVENVLLPYAYNKNAKILYLSNRVALNRQEKFNLIRCIGKYVSKSNEKKFNDDLKQLSEYGLDKLYDFGCINVLSYQSLLPKIVANEIKTEDFKYVVVDEAHFFVADAKFNEYTDKILEKILSAFQTAIKIFMTATPEEIKPLILNEGSEKYKSELINIFYKQSPNFIKPNDYNTMGIEQYCNEILDKEFQVTKLANEYLGEKERIQTIEGVNANEIANAIIYELPRNYDYCKIRSLKDENSDSLKSLQPLIQQIKDEISQRNTEDKYVIFIHDKKIGKEIMKTIGTENAVMVTRESKYADENDRSRKVYEKIIRDSMFEQKVLISTAVLDNGVNLCDKKIKHIFIDEWDKTKFIQMLGRVRNPRENEEFTLNVFLINYNIATLKKFLVHEEKALKLIGNFQKMDVQERKNKVKAMLKKYEVYNNRLRSLIILQRVFEEREDCMNKLAIEKHKYDIKRLEQYISSTANEDEGKISWIKEVMVWLGKNNEVLSSEVYFKHQSYDEILNYLKDYVSSIASRKDGLNKEEQKEFRRKITNFAKELKWEKGSKNSNDLGIGKFLIEEFFEEKNINYSILSERKDHKGPYWHIKVALNNGVCNND